MAKQETDLALQSVLDQSVRAACALGWQGAALFLNAGFGAMLNTDPAGAAATATVEPDHQPVLAAILAAFSTPHTWDQPQFCTGQAYYKTFGPADIDILAAPPGLLLALPLQAEAENIGWLVVVSLQNDHPPTPDRVHAVEALTGQIALTLHQACLYHQIYKQTGQQAVLNEIARTISQSLEIPELVIEISQQVRRLFSLRRASITLRETRPSLVKTFVWDSHETAELDPQPLGPLETLAVSSLIQQNQPYRLVSDLNQQPETEENARLQAQGFQSYICLPLRMWEQVIGVFCLAAEVPNTFSEANLDFLTEIGGYLAGAVWNALLHRLEHERRHFADALVRLSKAVNSTLELDEVLEVSLEQLARVITFDASAILLADGLNLEIVASKGFKNPETLQGAVFRVEENNIAHQVMRSQQARVEADVQQIEEWGHNRDDVEGAHTIRAWVGAPLIARGHSIGLLTINKFEPDYYTEADGEIVAAFAAQIAVAIHNARLYQAAQQERDRLAAILNDTSDAIIVLDELNHIWLLNPAAGRYLKVDPAQVIGQPVTALNVPELDSAFEAGPPPVTCEIARPGGTAFHASLAPVGGVGWVIVMQDITPLKELDRLRTEWVAAVSHDLKNPIQVIQLGTALLEMDGPLNSNQLDRVALIQRGADQLSTLVTDVLDLARLEAGPTLRMTLLNPLEVIAGTLSELDGLAEKNQQRLIRDIQPALPPVMGDAMLLRRALANLLGNAIKYTPAGGTITLRTRFNSDQLEITVSDTGAGIPAEALPYLFDRFYRVPGTIAEGTGLGLSIVKSIIEKHGGDIEVQSNLGAGTTFTIRLPASKNTPASH